MSTTRPMGKPQKPAADLAARRPGLARPNVEVSLATLKEIDREATRNQRSRSAEIRVLLSEALAARRGKRAEVES